MWYIKISIKDKIKHFFGKHIPMIYNDGSVKCMICNKACGHMKIDNNTYMEE